MQRQHTQARAFAAAGKGALRIASIAAAFVAAAWLGHATFTADAYAGPLRVYVSLALLSLATTAACESFLGCVDGKGMFPYRHQAAIMAVAGLLLTAVYGPQFFVRYYGGDDWLYMSFQFIDFDWKFINTPISNHYVPLLGVILRLLSTLSDPGYYGNALIFYVASMLVLGALARVIAAHAGDVRLVAVAAISFAIWPSFEGARTYFAGGFWLALPVAAFLATLLAVRRALDEPDPGPGVYATVASLAAVTVLGSSQILVPFLFVFIYAMPYLEAADRAARKRIFRHGLGLSILLLLPTLVTAYGRRQLLAAAPDLSGILDGAYLTNLALFVKAKVGFDKASTTILVCIVLYAGGRHLYRAFRTRERGRVPVFSAFLFLLVACGMTMPKMGFNQAVTPFWVGGSLLLGAHALYTRVRAGRQVTDPRRTASTALALCGLGMLMFYILQVGVGRRWGISTALADYYAMFPLAGFWMLAAGVVSLNLAEMRERQSARDDDTPSAGLSRVMSSLRANPGTWIIAAGLCVVFAHSLLKYLPTTQSIQLVMAQKQFVRDLGLAACAEARMLGVGERLLFREKQPSADCRACANVLDAPPGIFEGGFFSVLSKSSAQNLCPDVSGGLVVYKEQATLESSGQSAETLRVYEKYYQPAREPRSP